MVGINQRNQDAVYCDWLIERQRTDSVRWNAKVMHKQLRRNLAAEDMHGLQLTHSKAL